MKSADTQLQDNTRAMNEALLRGSLHQHELTEAAERLNEQLHAEIAERKLAEDALRISEERYRALVDLGPVAVYSCDADGVIQTFNKRAAELWGHEPQLGDTGERFCGSFKLYRPDGNLMPYAECPMAQVSRGEVPAIDGADIIIERPNGARATAVVNIRSVKNQQGEITGTVNCFYDITERSLLEHKTQEQAEALSDLHRRKDEFLAMLSHELRNPLAPISNAVQLLRLHKNDDAIQTQARTIIERQVGQLKYLIDDLLEVSRITTGRIQLRREGITVSGLVERAVETARPLIAQRRHKLEVSLPTDAIWLHADAARLEQVLVNLLTNAAKYTDEGGHIWLTVEPKADEVVLRVRDSGIGIAPEVLPHIFELFTQGDRSLDRTLGGLGIGLCLVQRLVHLHGGSVDAFSTKGQGSEFVVRLPTVQTSMASVSPDATKESPVETSRRILIVEDNLDTAHSLEMLLQSYGHDVRVAHDGPTGVEAALAYRPELVLLDIGLPGFSGYEVAKRIRETPTLRNVKLIAITGYGQQSDKNHALEAGFDHHLVKPIAFDSVQKILASMSDNHRRSERAN